MMRYYIFFLSLTILFGCTVPSVSEKPEPPQAKQIFISDIEPFRFGQDASGRIEAALGKPSKIISISSVQDLWVYDDKDGQRATFTLDRKSEVVLTATLLLKDSDPLHDLQTAISYFKNSKFSIRDKGWIARHERSSEASYIDLASGVSLAVNKSNKTVSLIGFGQPLNAPIAKQE